MTREEYPVKKKKKTTYIPNKIVCQLNENHKEHLTRFFDEDVSATIKDAMLV